MTSGLLPPTSGMWYLGEQCGIDTYLTEADGTDTVDIDVIEAMEHTDYTFGMFHGKPVEEYQKWVEAQE